MNPITLLPQLYSEPKIFYILSKLRFNYYSLQNILWSRVKHVVGKTNDYWTNNNRVNGMTKQWYNSHKKNLWFTKEYKNNLQHGKTILYYQNNTICSYHEFRNGQKLSSI